MILKKFTSAKGLEIILRKASEEDAAKIIEFSLLTLKAFEEITLTAPEEFTRPIEEQKDWIKLHNLPGSFLALAQHNSILVGIIHLQSFQKKKIAHCGELAIAIHPEFTDQKIGTEMMNCLLEWAKNQNVIEKIILNVNENNSRAVHIYKKLGFVQEGHNVKATKQKNGIYNNNIQMAWFK